MKYPEELLESNPLVEPEDYYYEEPGVVSSESEDLETENLTDSFVDETQPAYESDLAVRLNESEEENFTPEFENYTPAQKLDKVRDWAYLLGFKVEDSIAEALKRRSMKVQYAHNESYSNDLNTDFYRLQISRFPVVNGATLTPEALVKHIRLNINSLVDTSYCEFNPYSAMDASVWKNDNPKGTVLRLKITPDNAAVVVSATTSKGWRFSTVTTPDTGRHPVSGHREFFIGKDSSTGYYYFVVKGLDMFSSGVAGMGAPFVGSFAYKQGDLLWKSLIRKVTDFINANGGIAKRGLMYSERVEWRYVYHRYKNLIEQTFGKGAGSAEKSSFITFESEAGIDLAKAIKLNRSYSSSLGWNNYMDSINNMLLPLSGQQNVSLGEEAFARAVALWQKQKGFSPSSCDGIIGPNTWKAMRAALPGSSSSQGSYPPAASQDGLNVKISLENVLRAMSRKNYVLYNEPYKLNIVGIRSSDAEANRFDDALVYFYKNADDKWQWKSNPATTDPGTYYLLNPMNVAGTAIVVPGQYINSHKLGLHRGQYTALVQQRPIKVIRDTNKDSTRDFGSTNIVTGIYGINIHRATASGTSATVSKYSAGCQVFANSNDFNAFIHQCEIHKSRYGNNFTYTLLEERDLS